MSLSSNGITQDVIREMMPPYQLSADLLQATLAALAPPPPDATVAWRHARIARLVQEITAFMPADAAQARLAAQLLIVRELADTLAGRATAADATVEQMCRLSRGAAELVRTATQLERTLARHQQKPVAFFGTVAADAVDVAALDAVWCNNPMHREAAASPSPAAAGETEPAGAGGPAPAGDRPDAAPAAAEAEAAPAVRSRPARSAPVRAHAPAWRGRVAVAPCPAAEADVPAHAAGRAAAPRPAA